MDANSPSNAPLPPDAWLPARRLAQSVWGPVERFLHVEAAGGIVLLVTAAIALTWANSPWYHSYEVLWETPVSLAIGNRPIEFSLHFFINDVLMTIFFLLVGLEIKREIVEGALSNMQRAALPIAGALGGMLVPAAIYLALNPSGPAREGWGVPMATDIAFAVGVLTLLGKRVPATLRVLLLAVAIIDDIGAILVIAIFYSSGFNVFGLMLALTGAILLFLLPKLGVRPSLLYVPPIAIVWIGMYEAGVHPTIAGVIAGLIFPAKSWFGKEGFLRASHEALDEFQSRIAGKHTDRDLLAPLAKISQARREALSPAFRVETWLHPWVAYGIMPLFAFANAGVHLGGLGFDTPGFTPVMAGIVIGLVVGKPLGVLLGSWLVIRLRFASLPDGINWGGLFVVGAVAGIGFTMAIFIGELAFSDPRLLGVGKLGVLLATALAATVSLLAGRFLLTTEQPESIAHVSATEIESTTEYWTAEEQVPAKATE